jgi:hypothetical protein
MTPLMIAAVLGAVALDFRILVAWVGAVGARRGRLRGAQRRFTALGFQTCHHWRKWSSFDCWVVRGCAVRPAPWTGAPRRTGFATASLILVETRWGPVAQVPPAAAVAITGLVIVVRLDSLSLVFSGSA